MSSRSPPGPVGPGPREKADGLQEVGLALGVFPPDDVHPGVELGGEVLIVAKALQGDGADPSSHQQLLPPGRTPGPPGRSFFPPHGAHRPVDGDGPPSWMRTLASPPLPTALASFRRASSLMYSVVIAISCGSLMGKTSLAMGRGPRADIGTPYRWGPPQVIPCGGDPPPLSGAGDPGFLYEKARTQRVAGGEPPAPPGIKPLAGGSLPLLGR